ncbi:hypothetical protein [Paludisphaera mucosa]|uniref:DUF4395 domain-containing protein n=1 Tax=Paludisphaera mucosa TaxID=3030827 RepID=A0ABT6F7N6_9BACT|nr:hypothetical protein [Paludisphaera mucosa]MDG3003506.1 hypothetical protein [Paludisphaera mucosa]
MMAVFDPDLDTATYPTTNPILDVADHQRLIVNPLLTTVALLGVWALFRFALEVRNLGLFLATLFAALVCPLLIQYHCLDCGHTDFALRSRRHACAAVVHRIRTDAGVSALPPAVKTQIKSWVLSTVVAGLLYAIFRHQG